MFLLFSLSYSQKLFFYFLYALAQLFYVCLNKKAPLRLEMNQGEICKLMKTSTRITTVLQQKGKRK